METVTPLGVKPLKGRITTLLENLLRGTKIFKPKRPCRDIWASQNTKRITSQEFQKNPLLFPTPQRGPEGPSDH